MLRRNSLKLLIPPDSIIMSFSRPNAQTTDVCKWLHEHGAAEDITKENDKGETPMRRACTHCRLPVCQWLVLKGAMNRPVAPPVTAAAALEALVDRDTMGVGGKLSDHLKLRPKLLEWAQSVGAWDIMGATEEEQRNARAFAVALEAVIENEGV